MPDKDKPDYIRNLETRIEALEKSLQEVASHWKDWLYKRETPGQPATKASHPHGDRELRMVLMGPPGAGSATQLSC